MSKISFWSILCDRIVLDDIIFIRHQHSVTQIPLNGSEVRPSGVRDLMYANLAEYMIL